MITTEKISPEDCCFFTVFSRLMFLSVNGRKNCWRAIPNRERNPHVKTKENDVYNFYFTNLPHINECDNGKVRYYALNWIEGDIRNKCIV